MRHIIDGVEFDRAPDRKVKKALAQQESRLDIEIDILNRQDDLDNQQLDDCQQELAVQDRKETFQTERYFRKFQRANTNRKKTVPEVRTLKTERGNR